ncbi:MAG: hypothetical protein CVV50_05540 [Spirochaetae bacterium HGW-Spirochaetae-6]|jgi:hypothetical protein|nr:MAG: hypothetical protein CVV50_05540 [Spirochaetae bacterium HGW-Spirochaetae-6]
MTKHLEDIMTKWNKMLEDTYSLYQEGQNKFFHAAKSYFDGMQYFADMTGNNALSSVYKSLSDNVDDLQKHNAKK